MLLVLWVLKWPFSKSDKILSWACLAAVSSHQTNIRYQRRLSISLTKEHLFKTECQQIQRNSIKKKKNCNREKEDRIGTLSKKHIMFDMNYFWRSLLKYYSCIFNHIIKKMIGGHVLPIFSSACVTFQDSGDLPLNS